MATHKNVDPETNANTDVPEVTSPVPVNRLAGIKRKKTADVAAPPSPDPSGESQQGKVYELPGTSLRWLRLVLGCTEDSYVLMNRLSDATLPGLISGIIDVPKEKVKKPSCVEEAAFRCAHVCVSAITDDGQRSGWDLLEHHLYGMPAIGLKKAMVASMSFCNMKGKNKMNGTFFVNGPFKRCFAMLSTIPPMPSPAEMANFGRRDVMQLVNWRCRPTITEFGDAKMADVRAVTTSTGSASASIRLNLSNWFAEVYIGFYESIIGPNQIVQLVNAAGQHVGIGSNRAENSGDTVGLYRVISMEKLSPKFSPKRYEENCYKLPS